MVAEASVMVKDVPTVPIDIRNPSALLTGAPERISFGALAHYYSDLLGQTVSDLRLIAELGAVVYLIDADVVRNLVERRYRDQRVRHEAIRLFESPNFEYALPVGAFHEIVKWIRSFSSGHIQFAEARAFHDRLSRIDLIKELARLCNVPFSDGDKEENIVCRVVESAGEKNAVVSRLLSFLSNPRFRGIIADYRIDGVSKCFRVIRAHGSESERAGRDLQDAINLSLVFDSVRQERLDPAWESPCYVLITETRLLLNLASGPIDDEIAQDLASLNGLPGPFPPNLLPVMTPRRAFMSSKSGNSILGTMSQKNRSRLNAPFMTGLETRCEQTAVEVSML